jgi:hypothetical protein
MPGEVVDTNVLVLASALEEGWSRPRVPTSDLLVFKRVFDWLSAFRVDGDRPLVMDLPQRTIWGEYARNVAPEHYGMRVVQAKWDAGCLHIVTLQFESNGAELVALLPDEVAAGIHDLGDRKMVAAAFEASAPIVNAADSDWEHPHVSAALALLGVEVVQLLTREQRAACKPRSNEV